MNIQDLSNWLSLAVTYIFFLFLTPLIIFPPHTKNKWVYLNEEFSYQTSTSFALF